VLCLVAAGMQGPGIGTTEYDDLDVPVVTEDVSATPDAGEAIPGEDD
jgi:hypothetical protein